jgi:hypothetical protein
MGKFAFYFLSLAPARAPFEFAGEQWPAGAVLLLKLHPAKCDVFRGRIVFHFAGKGNVFRGRI